MRSILEVIVAVQEQQPATEEELRLTVVALSAMLHLVERSGREVAEAVRDGKPSAKMRADFFLRDHEIRFKSRKMTPADYLGPDHTPGEPENERLRKMAKAVFEKATGETL